jgi:hypothetical protein
MSKQPPDEPGTGQSRFWPGCQPRAGARIAPFARGLHALDGKPKRLRAARRTPVPARRVLGGAARAIGGDPQCEAVSQAWQWGCAAGSTHNASS